MGSIDHPWKGAAFAAEPSIIRSIVATGAGLKGYDILGHCGELRALMQMERLSGAAQFTGARAAKAAFSDLGTGDLDETLRVAAKGRFGSYRFQKVAP